MLDTIKRVHNFQLFTGQVQRLKSNCPVVSNIIYVRQPDVVPVLPSHRDRFYQD